MEEACSWPRIHKMHEPQLGTIRQYEKLPSKQLTSWSVEDVEQACIWFPTSLIWREWQWSGELQNRWVKEIVCKVAQSSFLKLYMTTIIILAHRISPALFALTASGMLEASPYVKTRSRMQSPKPALPCAEDKRKWPPEIPSKPNSSMTLKRQWFPQENKKYFTFLDFFIGSHNRCSLQQLKMLAHTWD